jgi:hypothetical protein
MKQTALFRIAITISFVVLLVMISIAQEKRYQAGFRMGAINPDMWAFEGILGFRSGGVQLYGLVEKHTRLEFPRTDRFSLYFGGGAHVGFVGWHNHSDYDYYGHYNHWERYACYGMAFGIDGILGMEYTFPSVPITLGADFKPFFEFYGPFYFRVNFWDFAFGIRYTF